MPLTSVRPRAGGLRRFPNPVINDRCQISFLESFQISPNVLFVGGPCGFMKTLYLSVCSHFVEVRVGFEPLFAALKLIFYLEASPNVCLNVLLIVGFNV